jgi:hypothetical protein
VWHPGCTVHPHPVENRVIPRNATSVVLLVVLAMPARARAQGSLPTPRDPVSDRGFLIAKGNTLPKGSGYVDALGPTLTVGAAYGVTDRLTVQVGTSFWTIPDGIPSGFLSARYGVVRTPDVSVAVGALGAAIYADNAFTAAAWPYVTTTVGTDRVSVSGLVGVGSSTTVFESDFDGRILLQGLLEAAVARNVKVLVEALYLGKDSDPAGAAGVRWFPSRLAFEVGWIHVFQAGDDVTFIPWGGISYGF